MGFDEITNILYLLLQGVGVGIAASITVGPVAVLCIQRTLSKSRRSGFGMGLGCGLRRYAHGDLRHALLVDPATVDRGEPG